MKIEFIIMALTVFVFASTALTAFFKKKEFEIKDDANATDNDRWIIEKANIYVELVLTMVDEIVKGLNQTVVDDLKKDNDGKLTKQEADDVFKKAVDELQNMLTNEGMALLNEIIRDVPGFLTWAIEAAVKRNK